jgi:hypothetical protein
VPLYGEDEQFNSTHSGSNRMGQHPTLHGLLLRFGDRLISFKTENIWAPHSPDLNPLDFFLWGYAKDNVYQNNPQTVQELKNEITQFIRRIPREMCERVIGNFSVRLNACLNRNG